MYIIQKYIEGYVLFNDDTGDRRFLNPDEIDIFAKIYKNIFDPKVLNIFFDDLPQEIKL